MNVNILKRNQPGYPEILNNITSPPQLLYYAGISPQSWINKPKVAIVGSRKCTPYGINTTTKLATELANAGVVIISGLAYGIDVSAHKAALAVNGITVAVLATGLDDIYPAAHYHIAKQMIQRGTLITERPARTVGFKSNFVIRNRIVSGLADVLLITEAIVNSGSLHTARFALEQGKTVMAVPGNINSPASEGCNNLIKSGAIPVTDVSDVFFALRINPDQQKPREITGSLQEKLVFKFIKDGLSSQEQLAQATKLTGPQLASTLTMLELAGQVRPLGSGNWSVR
jgi:DNA processing protein